MLRGATMQPTADHQRDHVLMRDTGEAEFSLGDFKGQSAPAQRCRLSRRGGGSGGRQGVKAMGRWWWWWFSDAGGGVWW